MLVQHQQTTTQFWNFLLLSNSKEVVYKRGAGFPASLFLWGILIMRFSLLIAVFLGFSACSGTGTPPPAEEGPGSFITGRSEQGLKLSDFSGLGGNDGAGLPINALLWRASLDIVATIPLDDVDTFGGAIVTEWYQLNQDTDERIKIAIFVLDRELRSDGIRVVVYVQNKTGDVWQDSGTDVEMGQQLEELILTRAREIRAAGVVESNS